MISNAQILSMVKGGRKHDKELWEFVRGEFPATRRDEAASETERVAATSRELAKVDRWTEGSVDIPATGILGRRRQSAERSKRLY